VRLGVAFHKALRTKGKVFWNFKFRLIRYNFVMEKLPFSFIVLFFFVGALISLIPRIRRERKYIL
jgi:hypothetical protein